MFFRIDFFIKYKKIRRQNRYSGYNTYNNTFSHNYADVKSERKLHKAQCNKTKHSSSRTSYSAYAINCYKQDWYSRWLTNGWTTARGESVDNKDRIVHCNRKLKDNTDTLCNIRNSTYYPVGTHIKQHCNSEHKHHNERKNV